MKNKFMKKVTSGGLLIALLLATLGFFPAQKTLAAGLTAKSDTMSRLQDNTSSNHTIQFTTPTGVAAAQTITVTFPAGFNHTGVVFGDIDVDDDATPLTLAGTCATTTWGAVITSQVLTLTSCTGTIAAGSVVTIKIGTNASGGTNQIENPDISSDTTYEIAIAGTMADSGQVEVQILMDDTVNITAAVDESIAFSISDIAVGFGDLSSATGRWATSDALGVNAALSEPTDAHTLQIATNATTGWAITYSGGLMTSGGNTIDDIAPITGDSNGSQDTEQFGISARVTTGNSSVVSTYLRAASANWNFVPSTTTLLVSENVPTAEETIGVSYLANISTLTQSGNYSTDITYIATATF